MGYTSERNNQIVIELLKHHNIKKIVASPGATNVSFVASVQQDTFFEVYSSVDERSAAYIACGLAEESGEVVVLSCTGATASRNYFPGLTEAFYRQLPILAITSTMPIDRIGHNIPQVIDRTSIGNDIAKLSVRIPIVKDDEDEWNCVIKANKAILELFHHGVGPVHMNVETLQSGTFDVKSIPQVSPIYRITSKDIFPEIFGKRVAVFVGAHSKWTDELTEAVDTFCEKYNGIVLGDHTSNYRGKYTIPASLVTSQKNHEYECTKIDLLVHIGNISGAYLKIKPKIVWRVNEDGNICDTFRSLRYVFEMDELSFFKRYNEVGTLANGSYLEYYELWKSEYNGLFNKIAAIPFSNIYIANELSKKLPDGSILHLGILNSLRSWNFFMLPNNVAVYSNTGGFGIDGFLSTVLGSSLAAKGKIVYGVLGDLAFFYDMNALGNRHFKNNVRLLVINNGRGQEFRNYGHRAAQFGEDTDTYIAAAGHYGNKSESLVKNYVEALGFRYITANDENSFKQCVNEFVSPVIEDMPLLFEVFTTSENETNALKMISTLESSLRGDAKQIVKNVIGDKGVKTIKRILKG